MKKTIVITTPTVDATHARLRPQPTLARHRTTRQADRRTAHPVRGRRRSLKTLQAFQHRCLRWPCGSDSEQVKSPGSCSSGRAQRRRSAPAGPDRACPVPAAAPPWRRRSQTTNVGAPSAGRRGRRRRMGQIGRRRVRSAAPRPRDTESRAPSLAGPKARLRLFVAVGAVLDAVGLGGRSCSWWMICTGPTGRRSGCSSTWRRAVRAHRE